MPTIDTSTIEGFSEMTAEQKVEALLKTEIPEKVDLSLYVSKDIADKYASEAADLKKQLKGKMTDDEAAKAQAEAERKDLMDKYNELLRKSTVAEHTAKYMAMGYDEKLARDTAEALFDGKMEQVFANQQKAIEAHDKALKAELLKGTPKPEGAGGGEGAEDPSVELARKLGKEKAASMNASVKGLEHYIR